MDGSSAVGLAWIILGCIATVWVCARSVLHDHRQWRSEPPVVSDEAPIQEWLLEDYTTPEPVKELVR